jgi:hypothetical protein
VMNGVRSEIALASAQELINVWSLLSLLVLTVTNAFRKRTKNASPNALRSLGPPCLAQKRRVYPPNLQGRC